MNGTSFMEPVNHLLRKEYGDFGSFLSREEKFLALIPALGTFLDYILTFILAGHSSEILLWETNNTLKTYMGSNFELFIFIAGSLILISLASLAMIIVLKSTKYKTVLQYAIVFTYFGYRIAGGLTWLS